MSLKEELDLQGRWLFRWRSYLPLTLLPLLFGAIWTARYTGPDISWWDPVCIGVSFLGMFIRCLVAGSVPGCTSGRNVMKQEAGVLNHTGVYSTVRHPLYLGNFLMVLGPALFIRSPWFVGVLILMYWMYYERIMFAEEEYLRRKYRASYEKWANRTPAVIPSLRRFVPSALPFSIRTVLRREYPGFFGLVVSFTFLHAILVFMTERRFELSLGWWIFLGTGLFLYIFLRTLKRHTGFLSVPGR